MKAMNRIKKINKQWPSSKKKNNNNSNRKLKYLNSKLFGIGMSFRKIEEEESIQNLILVLHNRDAEV